MGSTDFFLKIGTSKIYSFKLVICLTTKKVKLYEKCIRYFNKVLRVY